MRLSLIVLHIPEPSLDFAARFYGALLGSDPVREQHGGLTDRWSVHGDGLTIALYPADRRPHTATRLEWTGDAEAAVQRLIEQAHALPERHRDGGWWATDPCGNTVRLLST